MVLREGQVVVQRDDLLPRQVLYQGCAAPLGRPFNGGETLRVAGCHTGAVAQQRFRSVLLGAPARVVQRSAAQTVYGVRAPRPRRRVVQQRSEGVFVAFGGRQVQRSAAVKVARKRMRPVLHQPQAGWRPAVAGGVVQRPPAAAVDPFGEGTRPHRSVHVHEVVDVP